MTDDPVAAGLAEIAALRQRLARLEALATPTAERTDPVTITHPADFSTPEERRLRDIARGYRRDPVLERLRGLAAKAEAGNMVAAAELAAMAPSLRMALGYYETARAAAVSLGRADATTGETK